MTNEAVIIFRIGHLGDTVVALPCFHRIAQSFPDARRILVTNRSEDSKAAPVEAVLAGSGLVHETIYFPGAGRGWRDFARLRRDMMATGARTVIYVADRHSAAHAVRNTLRDVLFFRFSGIRRIVGASIARHFCKLKVDPATSETEREAERLARNIAALGPLDVRDPAMWDLKLQPNELQAADAALAPLQGRGFIALHIGGRVVQKDWGDANWQLLLQSLLASHGELALVFVGAGSEQDRAASMAALWPGVTLNLCGRLNPRESAAVLARARAFIGHDSGPMHLASAVGTPCIAMLGNYNMPKWWHPVGPQHRIIHDMTGLANITPAQVAEAVREVLAADVPARARMAAG